MECRRQHSRHAPRTAPAAAGRRPPATRGARHSPWQRTAQSTWGQTASLWGERMGGVSMQCTARSAWGRAASLAAGTPATNLLMLRQDSCTRRHPPAHPPSDGPNQDRSAHWAGSTRASSASCRGNGSMQRFNGRGRERGNGNKAWGRLLAISVAALQRASEFHLQAVCRPSAGRLQAVCRPSAGPSAGRTA